MCSSRAGPLFPIKFPGPVENLHRVKQRARVVRQVATGYSPKMLLDGPPMLIGVQNDSRHNQIWFVAGIRDSGLI
jgi:hypothetical protein